MAKVTGVVMEVSNQTMLLLTEDGEWARCAAPDPVPVPGQVVAVESAVLDAPDPVPHTPRRAAGAPLQRWLRRAIPAVAAAVLAALALGGVLTGRLSAPGLSGPTAVAMVAVDINPSVELLVGANGRVIAATPGNADGEALLAGLDLKGQPAAEAVARLIDKAAAAGFIRPDREPLIMASIVDMREESGTGQPLPLSPDQVAATLEARLSGQSATPGLVVVQTTTRETLNAARQAGLSINQYTVWQAAAARGVELPATALQQQGAAAALKAAGSSVEQVLAPVATGPPARPGEAGRGHKVLILTTPVGAGASPANGASPAGPPASGVGTPPAAAPVAGSPAGRSAPSQGRGPGGDPDPDRDTGSPRSGGSSGGPGTASGQSAGDDDPDTGPSPTTKRTMTRADQAAEAAGRDGSAPGNDASERDGKTPGRDDEAANRDGRDTDREDDGPDEDTGRDDDRAGTEEKSKEAAEGLESHQAREEDQSEEPDEKHEDGAPEPEEPEEQDEADRSDPNPEETDENDPEAGTHTGSDQESPSDQPGEPDEDDGQPDGDDGEQAGDDEEQDGDGAGGDDATAGSDDRPDEDDSEPTESDDEPAEAPEEPQEEPKSEDDDAPSGTLESDQDKGDDERDEEEPERPKGD